MCSAAAFGSADEDLDRDDARRAVGMLLQFGNPHRVARQMLAGEDAHAAGAFAQRPAEHVELRFALAAVRQIDRAAEMHRTERLEAARVQIGGARGRVVGGEGGALDALAVLQEVARRLVLLGLVQHAEQLEIVLAEHDGVVARAHLRRMRAARRER